MKVRRGPHRLEYQRQWRARRAAQLAAGEVQIVHGTLYGYKTYRCRCQHCTDATQAQERRKAERRLDTAFAANHRKQWTGAELDLATERDSNGDYVRTARTVAAILGRSWAAVSHIRVLCAKDPKYRRVIESMD